MPIIFLWYDMGCVGSAQWNVGEKRMAGLLSFIHPLDVLREKQIGAVALSLLKLAVVPKNRINIRVSWRIAPLTDATAPVDIDFVKAAALRTIRFSTSAVAGRYSTPSARVLQSYV
jgi:hypothetical protein